MSGIVLREPKLNTVYFGGFCHYVNIESGLDTTVSNRSSFIEGTTDTFVREVVHRV